MKSRPRLITFGLMVLVVLAWANTGLAFNEVAALAEFQNAVAGANPGAAKEEFQKTHVHPPTQAEADEMAAGIARSAIAVMEQGMAFEKRFPQSAHIEEVKRSLLETLSYDFGSMNFPIPPDKALDVEACARELMKQFPGDVRPWIMLVRVAARLPIPQSRALYEELSADATPEPARGMARIGLLALGRLGAPLNMNFTALDGRNVSLADYRGKVVLIDFWSTTCVPCVRDMPELKRLAAFYQAQGLEVIGISLDSDKQALQRFVQTEGISWPQYFEPSGPDNHLARELDIGSLPVLWLVDCHGNLCDMDARENLEGKIKNLLGNRDTLTNRFSRQ